MTPEEFIKTFTKEEILDTLFQCRIPKTLEVSLCMTLYEKKSNKLLNEMDQLTTQSKTQSIKQFMQNQKEWQMVDRKVEKLSKNFDALEW